MDLLLPCLHYFKYSVQYGQATSLGASVGPGTGGKSTTIRYYCTIFVINYLTYLARGVTTVLLATGPLTSRLQASITAFIAIYSAGPTTGAPPGTATAGNGNKSINFPCKSRILVHIIFLTKLGLAAGPFATGFYYIYT